VYAVVSQLRTAMGQDAGTMSGGAEGCQRMATGKAWVGQAADSWNSSWIGYSGNLAPSSASPSHP
jgi:hypothetical protein